MRNKKSFAFLVLLCLALFFIKNYPAPARATVTPPELNKQIKSIQEKIKKIEAEIEVYQKNIAARQKEARTLRDQLSVLGSRIEKTTLQIAVGQAKISELDLNVRSLAEEVSLKEKKTAEQKKLLASLLKDFHLQGQKNYLGVILAQASFADYFDNLHYLADLSGKIDQALNNLKKSREDLLQQKGELERHLNLIEDFQSQLKEQQAVLEEEKQAREILFRETKLSEAKFKLLLEQLRGEFDALNREATKLQRELEKKLKGSGVAGAPIVWPVETSNGLSAYFHDPSYPFRYLFEHSGLDIRVPQGTSIKASAPGLVAWAKTSRLYGNSIMIVHAGGIATLYAHLSKFNISADAFVEQGQVIGWSGGLPGTPGAGLSTGPHLHFEVRLNGDPQDPLNYLPK